jgi:uncharacterized iron-regulated protein
MTLLFTSPAGARTFIMMGLVWTCLTAAPSRATGQGARAMLWVDALRGEPIALEDMLQDLRPRDVVYLGEYHSIARHHRLEEELLRYLTQSNRPAVLALEHFEFQQQPALDRFSRGEIGLNELASQTDLARRWPGYTNYLSLLGTAQKSGVALLALNARSDTIRAVARKGLAGVSSTQRKELPEQIVLDDPVYERVLDQSLSVHMAFDPQKLRPVYEAQVCRDETMAARLTEYLASAAGKGRLAIVLCGRGHCEFGLGTPARVARRAPGLTQRILLFSESGDLHLTPAEQKQAREVEISHEFLREIGRAPGDYFHVVEVAAGGEVPPLPPQ